MLRELQVGRLIKARLSRSEGRFCTNIVVLLRDLNLFPESYILYLSRFGGFIFVNEDKKPNIDPSKTKLNWQPAIEIMGEVSTWVVVPIIFALGGGKILDAHFDTKPYIFLGLTFFAFAISCVGIVKVVRRYLKNLEREESENIVENQKK